MNFIAVFIGGGLGSVSRYGISLLFQRAGYLSFPFATLLSNVLACLLMGAAVYYFRQKNIAPEWFSVLITIGFCGGFSTFSAFSYETYSLLKQEAIVLALLNIFVSVTLGLLIMWFLLRD